MGGKTQLIYEFGPFRFDPREKLLLRENEPVHLKGKPFEALVVLVEQAGRLVGKDELMSRVWPGEFVSDASLTNVVNRLRNALGDKERQYLETVSGHGYRFTAGVRSLEVASPQVSAPDASAEVLLVEKRTLTRTFTEEELLPGGGHDAEPSVAPSLPAGGKMWTRPVTGARLLAVALLCGAAAVTWSALYGPWSSDVSQRQEVAAAPRPPRAIAVLPFQKIGGAAGEDEYLGLGMADALITRLGRSRRLVVRPTSAVRRYANEGQDPVAAGRQQGVDAVLDGSVQRAGERVRVTVQLVSVETGAPLWSGKFDEPFTDIFAVQDSISERVMAGLLDDLDPDERALPGRRRAASAGAYEAYLKGRYFWNKRTVEGYRKAVEQFTLAVELDPSYAPAHSGLADATLYLGGESANGQQEAVARGRASLRRAAELDPTLAEPHASLGMLAMSVDWDWAGAEREFQRAIELDPNYATGHHWYGEFLALMGRFDEAFAELERARELDPLSLIINADKGKVFYLARQYDRAVEQCGKTLEMDPSFRMARVWLAFSHSAKGEHRQAVEEFRKIEGVEDAPLLLSYLGNIYGAAGRREEARRVLGRLSELSKKTYVSPENMIVAHAGLGEKEEVFKWIERAFEAHDVVVAALKVAPAFDGLRDDPRYPGLLRRAGFTP